jgi:hypothetical protein
VILPSVVTIYVNACANGSKKNEGIHSITQHDEFMQTDAAINKCLATKSSIVLLVHSPGGSKFVVIKRR